MWEQMRDIVAAEREHSAVSGETYRVVSEALGAAIEGAKAQGHDALDEAAAARAVFEALSPAQLQEIIDDWMRAQFAI